MDWSGELYNKMSLLSIRFRHVFTCRQFLYIGSSGSIFKLGALQSTGKSIFLPQNRTLYLFPNTKWTWKHQQSPVICLFSLTLQCQNRGAASNYTHVSQSGKSPNSSQSRIWPSSKTKWKKCGARNIKSDGVLTTCNVSANEGGMDARLPAVLNFAAVFFLFFFKDVLS